MARRFDLCVIFAEMRTGSNHLEAMLDGVAGLRGLGELFNPVFLGKPKQSEAFGFDLSRREAEPLALLSAIRRGCAPDLPVFRYFHDHDPRVLDALLEDTSVAKVILRRNPLDSYISHKIAVETGQWQMTDGRTRKAANVRFEAEEFATMLDHWGAFSARLRHGLQSLGQTAFEIGYEDLGDLAVLDGLLRYLGTQERIDPTASRLKPQNPGGPRSKVSNAGEMEAALARLDPFDLARAGVTDRPRPPAVRSMVVAQKPDLMYLPVPGVLEPQITDWLEALSDDSLQTGLNQRDLRQWMRKHPGHRRFSVLNHPLARAHDVFCQTVLPRRPAMAETRRKLRKRYAIPLPQNWPDESYGPEDHRAAFAAFLEFLGPCLAGQTSIAPRPEWCGQLAALQGMAAFALPDRILRAGSLAEDLGAMGLPPLNQPPAQTPFPLAQIADDALNALANQVYRRDYIFFGFGPWEA